MFMYYLFITMKYIYFVYICPSASGMALNLFSKDLSEPVDVYSDWIDACEAANQ